MIEVIIAVLQALITQVGAPLVIQALARQQIPNASALLAAEEEALRVAADAEAKAVLGG